MVSRVEIALLKEQRALLADILRLEDELLRVRREAARVQPSHYPPLVRFDIPPVTCDTSGGRLGAFPKTGGSE